MPAVGAADGEAALLESLESDTETGVVDAQALAQDGPEGRLAGAAESGAHRLGERERRGRPHRSLTAPAPPMRSPSVALQAGATSTATIAVPRLCQLSPQRRAPEITVIVATRHVELEFVRRVEYVARARSRAGVAGTR